MIDSWVLPLIGWACVWAVTQNWCSTAWPALHWRHQHNMGALIFDLASFLYTDKKAKHVSHLYLGQWFDLCLSLAMRTKTNIIIYFKTASVSTSLKVMNFPLKGEKAHPTKQRMHFLFQPRKSDLPNMFCAAVIQFVLCSSTCKLSQSGKFCS